jgi:hypothetical protein
VSPILHGLEVDRKFERGRLRYWELRRFGSLENPSSIDVGLAIGIGEACRLANQAAGSDIVTDVVRYAQVSKQVIKFVTARRKIAPLL